MPEMSHGTPLWHDLTTEDATALVPFYEAVCNWTASDHDMGEYADFDMTNERGERVAGLCHARGDNASLPPVWMMYVSVPSLKDALTQVDAHGGTVVDQRHAGFAIVRDPAGAHFALLEQPA